MLVEAFSRIPLAKTNGMKLVVVGGAPYAGEYIQRRAPRGRPAGASSPATSSASGYWELQRNAYAFCAPTEVGGTHPVILEALAAGNCVIVNDHAPNVETVGDAGPDVLRQARACRRWPQQLERILDEPGAGRGLPGAGAERAKRYSWDAVTDEYEALLRARLRDARPGPAAARHGRLGHLRAGGQPAGVTFLRYGLPALICTVGIVWGMARGLDESGLEIAVLLVAAGSSLFLMNLLWRVGVSGDRDRDEEDAARRHFDEHGTWPDED